ncbi:MAG: DUF11 domain-containing protein [Myxococcales bacterium]|nr:DUF11 domain-containing protein [Myxococcales bacterium]
MTRRLAICFSLLCIALASLAPPEAAAQDTPAGLQEYFVLGRASQLHDFFQMVSTAEGGGALQPAMISVITLTATTDGQVILYDQWEDGYEPDILNPAQASTERYVRNRGQVISLKSDGSAGGLNAVIPIPRNPTDMRYDGGDRIVSIGGPVSLAHATWPQGNVYIGDAWEMYSRQAVEGFLTFRIPVGRNSYTNNGGDTGTFAPFKHVELQVAAFEDDTRVLINNGTTQVVVDLDRGQTYSTRGIVDETAVPGSAITVNENTTVSGTREIQVGILSGSDGQYQTRFYDAIPMRAYGRDYVVPVLGQYNNTTSGNVNIYLFNPNVAAASITIFDNQLPTAGKTFTLPANSAISWLDAIAAGHLLPRNSGARIVSDRLIWGVVAYDYTGTSRDWGFSLVPSRFLNDDYYISWAPVNATPAAGDVQGNCVWVTATQNGTTVYVDVNSDGAPDNVDTDGDGNPNAGPYALDVLGVLRVYDQTDGDNTGTHIWANAPIAVTYGQDAATAPAGGDMLDLGYTVLPLTHQFLNPILTVRGVPSATSMPTSGGSLGVTVTARAGNFDDLTNAGVSLEMSAQLTYVPNSAWLTVPGSPPAQVEPTITSAGGRTTLTWAANAELDRYQEIQVSLDVSFDAAPNGIYNFVAGAAAQYFGVSLNPRDRFDVVKTYLEVAKTVDRASATAGDLLAYTITVRNTSTTQSATGLSLRDPLNEGLDFVSASAPGAYDALSRSVVWNLGTLNAGEQTTQAFQARVRTLPEGTVIGNIASAFSNVTPRVDSNRAETVVEYPLLNVTKFGSPAAVVADDVITFRLQIENASALDAANVVLRDKAPAFTTYIPGSMTLDTGSGPESQSDALDADACDFGGSFAGEVTARFNTLPAHAAYVLEFRVQVNAGTPDGTVIHNLATIESDTSLSRLSNVVVIDVGNADPDGDGLTNAQEAALGTDPDDADSDDDGLSDGEEESAFVTDPLDFDSDDDGLSDGQEAGRSDGIPDPDGGGPLGGTDASIFLPDADPTTTTDPTNPDSDGDGLSDGTEDADHNGRVDTGETDPNDADSDGDNFDDGVDTCPLIPNPIQDLLSDPANCGACGNVCSDADVCTGVEGCSGGSCTAGTPLGCDDGNACTDDVCDSTTGCVFTPDDTNACDDGDACTAGDACQAGSCASGAAVVCDDGNACTDDACDPTAGCVFTPDDTNACDDGDACTAGDACQAGSCASGAAVVCDDGNACTDDVCDSTTGCVFTPDDTNACDDNDSCTENSCSSGACLATPLDADDDGYGPAACGGSDCDDSNASVNPAASEGPLGQPTCQDSLDNDCDSRIDGQDTGCQACQTDADCDDHDACNGPESCVDHLCHGGTALACDDGNPCTDDACDPTRGCTYTADDGNTCADADTCNGQERCQGGFCQPGEPLSCDDGDACTADSCDPAQGCRHEFMDRDADGICDAQDACPDDPQNQCGTCPDRDGDDICDAFDICPDDPQNRCQGCVDTDGDGSCDAVDPCPDDPSDACVPCVDLDRDELCDEQDPCPGDATNQCAACADPSDPDGDGRPTCVDPCPDDPTDSCVPCNDHDHDGTCDGQDPCPRDPTNACAVCADGDGDGKCDVNDPCPDDPLDRCAPCPDQDRDDICDSADPCPNDATNQCNACQDKRDPDHDGAPTCVDPCPEDPLDLCIPCVKDSDHDGQCDEADPCPQDALDLCGPKDGLAGGGCACGGGQAGGWLPLSLFGLWFLRRRTR